MQPTRVCLLTGASGRLGSMFCRLNVCRYQIVAVHRSRLPTETPQQTWYVDLLRPSTRLPGIDHAPMTIQADLEEDDEIRRVIDLTLTRFGRVDILVNAAAHSVWAPASSAEMRDHMPQMFRMNAIVPFRMCVELAERFWRVNPRQNAEANRCVVNVSSTAGLYAYPGQGQSGYAASKAALNMLTCHLADEFADLGIRVNALAPDSFPHRVTTESVADAIVRIDHGQMNGRIVILDERGETVV